MASVSLFFVFSFSLLFYPSVSLIQPSTEFTSLVLPLTKDASTAHYLAQIHHPTTHLLLDLAGSSVWLHCAAARSAPLSCRSIQCSAASSATCSSPTSACSLSLRNPVTGASATGELIQDTLVLSLSQDEQSPLAAVHGFLMSCAPSTLLHGLPTGTQGVLGFGRTRTGAPAQISHGFDHPKKFSLCLSSSSGMIFSGQAFRSDFSKPLIYTPLLNGDDYSINLKGIQIQNKRLSLGLQPKISTIKLSTTSQYSTMASPIYSIFVRAFTMAAKSLNLNSVEPVSPFGACFESGSVDSVPVIDLVLQSEMVKWRIQGHNSMVKVRENVICLGFLDGGENLGTSIVLGGHQLEDNLIEFDLGSSMLGFSSSLIMKNGSCSQLTSSSLQEHLQSI